MAIELGIKPGTSLADARAVEPGLVVQDHDPEADTEFLDKIADGCARYSPLVAVEPPDGIVLDITGVAHLWDNETKLKAVIAECLENGRITARIARASSAEAAHALARYSKGEIADEISAVRKLPIEALKLNPESNLGLRRAGLKTIGDVADRPRAVIAARFGSAAVFMLERLIGKTEKPLKSRSYKPPFLFERLFAEPIANKNYALSVLHALLEEAKDGLAKKDLGGRSFTASFCRIDGLTQDIHVETGRPTRDPKAIARLFDERLDTLADPLNPGFGFDSIRLSIPRTDPLKQRQEGIESAPNKGGDASELLDRIAVRLGRNRLLRFRPNNTHIPENTQVAIPAGGAGEAHPWLTPEAGEPPSRPVQLFDPPHRITVVAEIPDGPPRRFRWRGKTRDVGRYEGPERIASEWWRGSDDPLGRDQLTRDYYRVEDTHGHRYWVFRYGLFERETDDPNWYLHGLFA